MAENNTSRADELHAKVEAMRKKYNLPPVKESTPVTKTIKEVNGVECEVTEYDNGYTMAVPVDNNTYEQRIETLIVETSYLAACYYYDYDNNDCKEILEAFKAYFAVIYSSPEWNGMLHSEIIGNALMIFQVFQKFESEINPKIHGDAFNAIYWIWEEIESLSLGLEIAQRIPTLNHYWGKVEDANIPNPFDEPDECRKAIREYYREYSATFEERQKEKRHK